ncbi:cytadherence high molecular weight protein 1-like [Macrobrachium rosenbergii]|uniref:cytadherence high molecular weight protein 1-like n=1 Tax=Macrobrachium rosenbergii TaxID=79674 RepID=UPI0034D6EDD5
MCLVLVHSFFVLLRKLLTAESPFKRSKEDTSEVSCSWDRVLVVELTRTQQHPYYNKTMGNSRTGGEKQKCGNSEASELSSGKLLPRHKKNSRGRPFITDQQPGTCSSYDNPFVRTKPTDESSKTCSPRAKATVRPRGSSQDEASVRPRTYDQSSGVSNPSESLSVRPKIRPQEVVSVRAKIRPEVVSVRAKIKPQEVVPVRPKIIPEEVVSVRHKIIPEVVSVRPKIIPEEAVSVRPKIIPEEVESVRPKIRPQEVVSVRPKIIPEVVSVRPKIIPEVVSVRPKITQEVVSVRPKVIPEEVVSVRPKIGPQEVVPARPKTTVRSSKIKKPHKCGKSRPRFWVPVEQPFHENMQSPAVGAVAITPQYAEIPEACPRSCEYHTIHSGPFANVVSIHSPHTKEWQKELSCLERTRTLRRYLLKVLPNWSPYLSTHSEKVQILTFVSQQTERDIFEAVDSKEEYYTMMREKSNYLIEMIGEKRLERPRVPSPCRDPYN